MPSINILDKETAELIAAGEVIETPLIGDKGACGKLNRLGSFTHNR